MDLPLAAGDTGEGERPPGAAVAVLRLSEGASGDTLAVAADAGALRLLLHELRGAREALAEAGAA